jgi:hypothetical protein
MVHMDRALALQLVDVVLQGISLFVEQLILRYVIQIHHRAKMHTISSEWYALVYLMSMDSGDFASVWTVVVALNKEQLVADIVFGFIYRFVALHCQPFSFKPQS